LPAQGAFPAEAPAAPAAPAAAAKAPDVDMEALAALIRMGLALRSHTAFDLKAEVTNEDVLRSGQKLQYEGTLNIRARRPDRFKVSAVSDLKDRQIFYDGKTVTIFSPRLGMYGTFDAPPTIAQALQTARERYDVQLPLADLFTWGTDDNQFARLTSGFMVRPEHIDGKLCNHYAFRQPEADWQIWIADDESALPCKLVITSTGDSSRPQYSAVLHWSFPETIDEDVFTFKPPADAQRIVVIAREARVARRQSNAK